MVGEVVGNSGPSTEHQEVGGLTSTGVWGAAAINPHDLRKHRIPFLLTAAKEQASERITQHTDLALPRGWYGVVLL